MWPKAELTRKKMIMPTVVVSNIVSVVSCLDSVLVGGVSGFGW